MPSQTTIEGIVKFASRLEGIDLGALREGLEIARLHRQLEQLMENDLAGKGMTARQIEILEGLYHSRRGNVTPADLSDEVGLTRSAMTSALDSLEKQGHIVRSSHPTDRRMTVISLTDAGRACIEKHLPERYERLHKVFAGCLSKQEREILLHAYVKVLEYLMADLMKGGRRATPAEPVATEQGITEL